MPGLSDFIGNNAGSFIGGLLGAGASKDTTTGTTASSDPWGPAQPHILRNLQNEADLQSYYQKTPFNAQQQEGYSNLFGDIANFRNSVAPGLMDFANKGMAANYQRAQTSAPGQVGYSSPATTQAQQGPFRVAQGAATQNPMLDLNGAQNPFVNGAIKSPEEKAYTALAQPGLTGIAPSVGGNGGRSNDSNPSWTAMSDDQKRDYYNDHPKMAQLTQLMQMGFAMTDLAKLQEYMAPGFADQQRDVAKGYAYGDGLKDIRNALNGLGYSDPSQLGINIGTYGSPPQDVAQTYLTGLLGPMETGSYGSYGGLSNGGYNTGLGSYGGSMWGGGSATTGGGIGGFGM